MRKRKSPIVLVTALVVLVTGVAGFNYAASKSPATAEQASAPPVADDEKVLEKPRGAVNTTNVADQVKAQMGNGTTPTDLSHGTTSPGTPMILNDRPMPTSSSPTKPTPNATSTSTQWYNDETANGSKN